MGMRRARNRKAKVRSQIEEVKASSRPVVRPQVMEAFEQSVVRNRERMLRLAKKGSKTSPP